MGLCVYHSVVSTTLFQAPRFIPHSFGLLAEQLSVTWKSMTVTPSVFMMYLRYKITPEIIWGTLHVLSGLEWSRGGMQLCIWQPWLAR